MAMLEEETGLSRGAIFNYFPSKWEIFYALAVEDFTRGIELFIEDGYEATVRFIVETSPDWMGVYLELARQFRKNPELRERWESRNPELVVELRRKLTEQQQAGKLRDDVPLEEIGMFLGVILDGLALRTSFGLRDDPDALLRLVNSAIAPRQ